jgi:hypothetical protein
MKSCQPIGGSSYSLLPCLTDGLLGHGRRQFSCCYLVGEHLKSRTPRRGDWDNLPRSLLRHFLTHYHRGGSLVHRRLREAGPYGGAHKPQHHQ